MQKNNTNQNLVFKYYDIIIIRCILNGGQFNNITQTGFSDFNLTFKKQTEIIYKTKKCLNGVCILSGLNWITVMAKNIGTLAILSENATLLSENCSNCKCFGIHVLIVFACTATTQKKQNKIKLHTELKNGLDKIIGTLSKLYEIIAFQACDAPVICI